MGKLSSVRIARQIWIALGIAISGIVCVAVLSISTVQAVRIKGDAYNKVFAANVLLADVLPPPEYIVESRLVILEMVGANDAAELKRLDEKLTALRGEFEGRADYWKKNSLGKEMDSLLAKSGADATAFYEVVDKDFRPAIARGDKKTALALTAGILKSTYESHREGVNAVVAAASKYSADSEASATRLVRSRTRSLLATIAAAILLSLGLGWLIIRSLTRQLHGATDALSNATDRLLVSTGAIRDEASRTARQSADVAASGDAVNDGISTVAAACDQLTASITEISCAASEAVGIANAAVEEADAALNIVGRLDASSTEISNVVELISTIAEQTNLLALNATIEAARAGEMGRGFAVVANEVKELANKTSIATGEIAEKIRNVQAESASAIESIRRVADIVSQINGIQTTVAGAVEEQVATTNEIARNLNAAASGTSVVTDAIGEVASAAEEVGQNVTTAELVGRDLGEVASDLRQMVGSSR